MLKFTGRKMLRLLACLGIAGFLLLTGCSDNAPHTTNTSGQSGKLTGTASATKPSGSVQQPVVGLSIGDLAPDFSIPMSDGKTLKLSQLRGKPVFLNFWATWCPPCQMEMPDIQKISQQNYPVQIIGVNLKETPMVVEGFMTRKGYNFPVGFDLEAKVALLYNASGIPTSYAIDAKGIIRHVNTGPLSYAELKQWFTELSQTT